MRALCIERRVRSSYHKQHNININIKDYKVHYRAINVVHGHWDMQDFNSNHYLFFDNLLLARNMENFFPASMLSPIFFGLLQTTGTRTF